MTKKNLLIILFILFLSTVLRFYRLGDVPHGMTWDEAAIGYNGHAILTTRRDEWLERLPVSFKSFGDYKAPLAIYLNGFSTFIFGMNLFAVRLPFALFGVGSVLGIILLTREFLSQTFKNLRIVELLSYSSGLFLAVSPWHLHYSRAGFESGISLFFLIWGVFFLIKFFNNLEKLFSNSKLFERNFYSSIFFLTFAVLSSVLSIYSYHSAKITTPLLILFSIFYFRKKWYFLLFGEKIIKIKFLLLSFLAGFSTLFLLRPMILDSIYGNGLARSGTLVFGQNLSAFEMIKTVILNFSAHFSPAFLFLGETTTLRHGDGVWGVLFPTTWIIFTVTIVYSLILFLLRRKALSHSFHKNVLFGVVWIILGILPAGLGLEIPHSNRALLALPGFIIVVVLGISEFHNYYEKVAVANELKQLVFKSIFGMSILLHLLFFVSYLGNYYGNFAKKSAESFNDGYIEAFNFVIPYEEGIDGNKEVDKIIFTSEYGQPYIYALFTRKTNPIWYQGGSLIKYEFKEDINVGDLSQKNAIVVAGISSELLAGNADHLIYGSDGEIRFKIFITEN